VGKDGEISGKYGEIWGKNVKICGRKRCENMLGMVYKTIQFKDSFIRKPWLSPPDLEGEFQSSGFDVPSNDFWESIAGA
jgi:hypothetical protein